VTYRLKYTQTFEKQIEKIKKKDKALTEEGMKKVEKLQEMPYTGKSMKYRLAPYRSVRVKGNTDLYIGWTKRRNCEGLRPTTPRPRKPCKGL